MKRLLIITYLLLIILSGCKSTKSPTVPSDPTATPVPCLSIDDFEDGDSTSPVSWDASEAYGAGTATLSFKGITDEAAGGAYAYGVSYTATASYYTAGSYYGGIMITTNGFSGNALHFSSLKFDISVSGTLSAGALYGCTVQLRNGSGDMAVKYLNLNLNGGYEEIAIPYEDLILISGSSLSDVLLSFEKIYVLSYVKHFSSGATLTSGEIIIDNIRFE